MNNFKNKSGFSLLEVLIFISILSFVFLAAAFLTSLSLKNLKSSESKIFATRYGQEAIEWLRGEKETDWEGFNARAGQTYCFDTSPINTWPAAGSCLDTQLIDNLFKREASLSYDPDLDRTTVQVTVSWVDGSNNFNVPIKTIFSQFE